jgi:hypothetical protein
MSTRRQDDEGLMKAKKYEMSCLFDFLIPVSSLAALTLLYNSTGSAGVASMARLGMWVKSGFMKDKWMFLWYVCSLLYIGI